jgi:hypothetical protein
VRFRAAAPPGVLSRVASAVSKSAMRQAQRLLEATVLRERS